MFAKHLAVGEAYQTSAAKAAEKSLAEAGVRLAMILNEAAKAARIVPLKAGQRVIPP